MSTTTLTAAEFYQAGMPLPRLTGSYRADSDGLPLTDLDQAKRILSAERFNVLRYADTQHERTSINHFNTLRSRFRPRFNLIQCKHCGGFFEPDSCLVFAGDELQPEQFKCSHCETVQHDMPIEAAEELF